MRFFCVIYLIETAKKSSIISVLDERKTDQVVNTDWTAGTEMFLE